MPAALSSDLRDAPVAPRAAIPARSLLGALAVWLLATLWARPLALPDEGRYAETARAALHGPWWVPTLNGLPFFHKPPLMYWLDAAAMQLLGSTVFAARLAPAIGAWLMGASLLLALRRWHGAATGTTAVVVLATTPMFFLGGQYANHDMLVAGLITAAILAAVHALDPTATRRLAWLVAAWALCALAVLAKGLIGIVLPALVVVPWLLATGRARDVLRLLHPLGLVAFAGVCAPWFVAVQGRYPGFYDYFFMEQHVRRYAQSSFNNVHGPWFFVVVLPLATLPWSLWLRGAARRAWSGRRALPGLYAWWVVAVVVFFTIPSSKLVGYVLPALAPWCALLAMALERGAVRRWQALALGTGVVCAALVGALAWKTPGSNRALADVLAREREGADRVVMVDEYLYDVPFYARLDRPVRIASDWLDPSLPAHDNWRKELFDAAAFDPALGREVLVPVADLDRLACGEQATWFIVAHGRRDAVARIPAAQRRYSDAAQELWRVPAQRCP